MGSRRRGKDGVKGRQREARSLHYYVFSAAIRYGYDNYQSDFACLDRGKVCCVVGCGLGAETGVSESKSRRMCEFRFATSATRFRTQRATSLSTATGCRPQVTRIKRSLRPLFTSVYTYLKALLELFSSTKSHLRVFCIHFHGSLSNFMSI